MRLILFNLQFVVRDRGKKISRPEVNPVGILDEGQDILSGLIEIDCCETFVQKELKILFGQCSPALRWPVCRIRSARWTRFTGIDWDRNQT